MTASTSAGRSWLRLRLTNSAVFAFDGDGPERGRTKTETTEEKGREKLKRKKEGRENIIV
jgi:hypothetical protein